MSIDISRRMTSSWRQLQIKKNVLTHSRVEIRVAWCGIRLQEDISCSKLLFGPLSQRVKIWNLQQKWSDDITFCRGVEWRINKSTYGTDHDIANLEIQDSFWDWRSFNLANYYKATILTSTDENRGRNTYKKSFIYKIDDDIISDKLVLTFV